MTNKSNRKNRIAAVLNHDFEQDYDKLIDKLTTNKRQADDRLMTTDNNNNKENKNNKYYLRELNSKKFCICVINT